MKYLSKKQVKEQEAQERRDRIKASKYTYEIFPEPQYAVGKEALYWVYALEKGKPVKRFAEAEGHNYAGRPYAGSVGSWCQHLMPDRVEAFAMEKIQELIDQDELNKKGAVI
jgi:hypothetical protein